MSDMKHLLPVILILFLAALAFCPALPAQSAPVTPGTVVSAIQNALSTSASFAVIPIDTWGSGDFDALADTWCGYTTPRQDQLSLTMERTSSTIYEGDLFFNGTGEDLIVGVLHHQANAFTDFPGVHL